MNIIVNSRFNPYTYEELVKPLEDYTKVYNEVEAQYADLAQQTEEFRDIATRENSPEAYRMFNKYANDLETVVGDFSRGMTTANRRQLLNLRRRYSKEITPIAKADVAMKEANALRAQNPDAIFQVSEYTSLDQFLHGKTANNKYQSREALTKKTAALTEAAMAEALKDPDFVRVMGDQYWLVTQHTGGSYAELTEALKLGMMDNPIAQNKFSEIRQRVAKQAGIADYDAQGQQAIMDAIDTGLYAGLDKPVRTFQANQDHVTPVQAHSMRMSDAQLKLTAASSGMELDSNGNWVYNPQKDPNVAKAKAKGASGSGEGGKQRENILSSPVVITLGQENERSDHDDDYGNVSYVKEEDISGVPVSYNELDDEEKEFVDKVKRGSSADSYNYYRTKTDRSWNIWSDNAAIAIVPKKGVDMTEFSLDLNAH